MATIFDTIAQSLATVLGTDVVSAGWILGFVTIFAIVLTLLWAGVNEMLEEKGMIVIAGFAVAFVIGVGWWQPWAGILIATVLMFVSLGASRFLD